MRRPALAVTALLLATPVLAQSLSERSGLNSLMGASPSTADFVKEAAVSDLFELQSSQLAAERADEATKAFAAHMITDHQKTSTELKTMVQSGAVKAEIPTTLDSAHQSKLDTLKGLNGDAFTKQYRADQVKAHKDAVDLFQRYAKGGDNAELKAWAGKTEPSLAQHLKMAEDLGK
ncbi:DUF4142 domain-containing protein [Methylobacterium sp. ID0610]|uniref:DUF4142 domain-containing protein n=1 Tax=Methylobacterium carpenticola TaxID=3344827 RepID=UPI003674E81E